MFNMITNRQTGRVSMQVLITNSYTASLIALHLNPWAAQNHAVKTALNIFWSADWKYEYIHIIPSQTSQCSRLSRDLAVLIYHILHKLHLAICDMRFFSLTMLFRITNFSVYNLDVQCGHVNALSGNTLFCLMQSGTMSPKLLTR